MRHLPEVRERADPIRTLDPEATAALAARRAGIHRRLRRIVSLLLVAASAASAEPVEAGVEAESAAGAATVARTLYLVRHGAYDENDARDERIGKGLVPIGVAQARLAGARLRGLPFRFDTILASPLTRARETAAVIAADLPGAAVEIDADLAECTPPTRRLDVMKEEKPEELAACSAQLERLRSRLFSPAAGQERHDLVVAHGNIIRSLVVRALGVDPDSWLVMSIGHASLTVIRVEPTGEPRLLAIGDVGHLPPNLQTGRVGDAAPSLAVPAGTAGKP